MASKKPKKRNNKKSVARTITGNDASILSFVARNGLPPQEHRREIQKYLTPHVVKVAFSSAAHEGKKAGVRTEVSSRKGRKTLTHLRRLAETNAAEAPSFRRHTGISVALAKSAGQTD
jgi:hypothetical protein